MVRCEDRIVESLDRSGLVLNLGLAGIESLSRLSELLLSLLKQLISCSVCLVFGLDDLLFVKQALLGSLNAFFKGLKSLLWLHLLGMRRFIFNFKFVYNLL